MGRHRQRLSESQQQALSAQVVALRKEGASHKKICRDLELSSWFVTKILHDAGMTRRTPAPQRSRRKVEVPVAPSDPISAPWRRFITLPAPYVHD